MQTAAEPEIWLPKLYPKGFEVFNAYDRAILVEGPRKAGKTLNVAHRTWRHLWEIPGARVGLFAKTVKSAKDGGVWADVLNTGQKWMDSGMVGATGLPLEFTSSSGGIPGPRTDGATRTMSFRVRNMWGGESELYLFSLDDDKDVQTIEAKVKNLRFSLIWFSELSNFTNREVFNVSVLALRMEHLTYSQQHWIADTNPAKEGKDSWIYKLWHEDRIRTDDKRTPAFIKFQKGLRLIQLTLDDNTFLDPDERAELEGMYMDDPGEYDRNVLGVWTKGKGGIERIFADIFVSDIHIIEGAIDIPPETDKLLTGWDIGSSINHAAVIIEKRLIKGMTHYMILEEHVTVEEKIKVEQFAYDFYQQMLQLEEFYKRKFNWVHWSDTSSMDVYRATVDAYDSGLVAKATNGRVELQGADKPRGSVETGIKMMRRLIRENRLFVGENCPWAIRMFQNIEHGTEKPVDDGKWKHIFDAVRYVIYMEERKEANYEERPMSRGVFSV